MDLFSEDYLAHHGILGQKWGVRRFQNEDDSLKPAGQKRYGDGVTALKNFGTASKTVLNAVVYGVDGHPNRYKMGWVQYNGGVS